MLGLVSPRFAPVLLASVALLAGCERTAVPVGPGSDAETAERVEPPKPLKEAKPAPEPSTPGSRPDGGRWAQVRVSSDADADLQTQIRQLEALGYASGTKTAPGFVGVTIHESERAQPGLNLYTSGHKAEAELMTMDGRVVHRWAYDFWDVWPNHDVDPYTIQTQYWRRVHLFENGDLLVIFEGLGLIKLDEDSKLLWARRNRAHHDLHVLPNGDIAVLTRKARPSREFDSKRAILEDFVVILGPKGQRKARYSLLKCFERSRKHADIWKAAKKRGGDVLHTNSIEVLDGRFVDRNPALAAGNFLLSSRALSTVFVVDHRRNRVVWALQSSFKEQHDAQMLDSGDLMLFDNRGRQGASAVQVYDPATSELKWEYGGTDDRPFYTRSCGAAQRLPNGNTLVTESDNGRAFEFAEDGTIVWEFYNPHRAGDNDEFIATLFLVERLPSGFPTNWLDAPQED
jgi:hypothetical protein